MFKKKSNVAENIVLFPTLGSTSQGNNNEKDESMKEM